MKKILCALALALPLSSSAFAQKITEYGKPAELKGVTKIFVSIVYGGSVELKDRDRIKALPNGNQRLIMDSSNSQVSFLQNAPATSFGKAFMKAYVNANADTYEKKK